MDCHTLLAEYEAEQKALQEAVAEMESNLSAFEEDTDRAEQFLELAKKYTDFSELTTPMINEFIDKIIVHAPEKVDGDRVQEVEIYLKFIGRFDLPAPELTAEEIKRQEQLKRHRIKSRERYQKIKAGEHAVGQPFKLICKCCGTERWNSEEQLVLWRKEWADVTNRYLEQYGHDARIDHRSHADRGLTEQPTIHEGVVARALEKKGIISDRCEINRQIRADNALLRELKSAVKKLMQAVKNTVPAIAEAMEKLRGNMLIFSYQLRHIGAGKHNIGIRTEQERSAIDRVKAAYGEKYDFAMMAGCKQEVASLLHEEAEIRSVREQLLQRRHQQTQQKQTPKKHRDNRER